MRKQEQSPNRLGARRAVPMSLMAAAVIIAVAVVGIVYGLWSQTLAVNGPVVLGNINADFIDASTDDPPGNSDPGYVKDVASCTATVVSEELVEVVLSNGYPSYTCTFTTTIQNGGSLPERREPLEITAPPVLTVTELSDLAGVVLAPGDTDIEEFRVHVEQEAQQNFVYTFTIRKPFSLFVTGTIGFWKNWDSHNTFTQAEIEDWLQQIGNAKLWQGPNLAIVGDMEAVLQAANGQSATPESRFLAHCLATWLDERSGILNALDTHNVKGEDAANYLGLANPNAASLDQIQIAIEAKFGTSPSNTEFNVMKGVCDALNNLDI